VIVLDASALIELLLQTATGRRVARWHPHDVLSSRVWELRANVTAYDAAYLALAEALRAPLLTTDARFARAPGHHATVEIA
jgi:predicted nucleic acid-binding protein